MRRPTLVPSIKPQLGIFLEDQGYVRARVTDISTAAGQIILGDADFTYWIYIIAPTRMIICHQVRTWVETAARWQHERRQPLAAIRITPLKGEGIIQMIAICDT